MGKKSRRARARARAKARARAEQSAVGGLARSAPAVSAPTVSTPAERIYHAEPKPAPKATVTSAEPAVSSAQATRYQYILPELRLIGIISGSLFLVLIILAFVLG